MALHLSKRIVIFAAAAIIGGFGSFQVGYTGLNPVRMIDESRCRAGAFLGRTNAPGYRVSGAPWAWTLVLSSEGLQPVATRAKRSVYVLPAPRRPRQ